MTKCLDTEDWTVEMSSRSGGTVSCGVHRAPFSVSNLGFVQIAWPPGEPAADDHTLRRCAQEAADAAVRCSRWLAALPIGAWLPVFLA